MLRQSQVALLLTDGANLSLARELGDLPLINVDDVGSFSITNPGVIVQPNAIAAIAYTSGSTGKPKGIMWSHRGVLHAVMRHTNTYQICMHDRLTMFRASLRGYLYALLNGGHSIRSIFAKKSRDVLLTGLFRKRLRYIGRRCLPFEALLAP